MRKVIFFIGVVLLQLANGLANAASAVDPNKPLNLALKEASIDLTAPKTEATTIPPVNFTCLQPGGTFPHERRCDYYFVCVEGEATLIRCPSNFLFDLRLDGCNYPEQTECQDRERPPGYPEPSTATTGGTPEPTEPTPPPSNFTCPEPGGAFPHAERCEYYWLCQEDVPTLLQCELNYLFDLVYAGCNFPELTYCQDRERPPGYPEPSPAPTGATPGPTEPTPPPSNFTCPEPGGAFPHAERCEYYWLCQENVPTLLQCELNYLFDLVYAGCNFPELTCCQDRERPPTYPGNCTYSTTTTTTTNPPPTDGNGSTLPTTTTTRRPGEFQCPEPDGYFADPEDCAGYYQCAGNIAYHHYCPDGLYFDPTLGICNHPSEVDCENRPTDIFYFKKLN